MSEQRDDEKPEVIRISRRTAKKLADQARLPEDLTDRERADLLKKVADKLREKD